MDKDNMLNSEINLGGSIYDRCRNDDLIYVGNRGGYNDK